MPPGLERYRFRDRDDYLWRRRALGTQREVAPLAGCSHQYLGQLEAGRRAACSRAIASGIARALDVPVEQLFVRVQQAADPAEREVSA